MRGEVKFNCADNSRDTFRYASYHIIKKKTCSLSAVIAVESERIAVNCVGGLIIALYRNYND